MTALRCPSQYVARPRARHMLRATTRACCRLTGTALSVCVLHRAQAQDNVLRTIAAVLRHPDGRKSKRVLGLCPAVLDLVSSLQAINRDREARMALLSLTFIAEASTEFFEPHLESVRACVNRRRPWLRSVCRQARNCTAHNLTRHGVAWRAAIHSQQTIECIIVNFARREVRRHAATRVSVQLLLVCCWRQC